MRNRGKIYDDTIVALYSVCRAVILYCGASVGKRRVVGIASALGCCGLVASIYSMSIIPFAVLFGAGTAAETVLECLVNDYLTFIVLLFGLFCVAGNITMEGDLAGSPRVNIILLTIGTLLSS